MLKPIKNFLTYLQRNANSSNIFGLTTAPAATTMGPTGGVEEPVARLGETVVLETDELVVEDRDPLCDPLALDDECQDDEVVQHQDSANESGQLDDETAAAGNIIIVDVSTLKSRIALENGEYGDQLEKEAVQTISPSVDQCLLPEEHDEAEGSIYVLPLSDLSSNAESLDRSRDEDTNSAATADATTGSAAKAESAIVEESIKIPVDSSTDSVVEILPDNGDECVEDALLVEDTTPSLIVTENESFTTVESSMEIDEEEVIDGTEEIPNIQHEDPRDGDEHPRTGEGAEVVQANVPKTGAAQCVNSDMAQTVNRDGALVVQGTTVVDTLPTTTSAGEEEEASDGSDSGLGLEPVSSSHPIAVLDVDLLPPIKSSLKRRSEPIDAEEQGGDVAKFEEKGEGATSQKRAKKGICFDGVTVYYFPRMQGFGCVPSQGGCTLGMESQHVHSRRLTLAEHAAEQRKVHRQQLQELNQRSSSSEDSSSDEEPSESGSEAESESYGFLQPVSARQRRALLKAAGVRRIDPSEKDECREIRTSREVCGCTCRGFCNPNTCACSLAGIKCQVDRPSFPCGCTHDSCHNTAGRVEFNPNRVRSHFMHTIMRLSLEDKANEMRQTMQQQTVATRPPTGLANGSCANEGTVTAPAPKLLLTVDAAASTNSSSSGYLGSASEKNWSSGPVRLPPTTMTIYDGAATAGAGSLHASEHAHALQQLPHQQQLQLQPQQHHLHHPQPTMLYPNDPAVGLAHINSSAHMVPLQSPYHQHPLTHHLSSGQGPSSYQDYYRDYYIGTTSMGMSHLAATPPPLHYYGGYVGPGHNSIDPYQAHQQQMHHQLHQQQQQHVAASMAIGQQHLAINDSSALLHHQPLHHGNMLSTGHDRHASSYEINGIDSTLQSNSSVVSIHANVTSPATNSSEGPPTDQASIVKQPTVCDSYEVSQVEENEDLKSTLISPPDGSAPENVLSERSTQSEGDSSVSIPNCKNPSDTTFFDLTTPNAGNAERLEAINGMLECTRHTASMVQRASLAMTVAAEEDSELRDFCHSPQMPLESVSDDPAESTKPWDQTEHLSSDDEHASCPEALEVPNGTSEQHENEDQKLDGDVAAEYLNGSGLASTKDAQPDRQETGYQHSNNSSDGTSVVTEPSSILVETNTPERPSVKSSPVVAVSADELVPVQETVTVANVCDSVEATVDPNENLSEIIKNSIVETAVSH
uniref:Putative cysteine/serine-rich nuclear protein 3 n=1 Tax=Anopheles triannulatus TaxID=58253 RepID=A0A2M4AEN5_9DIPT